MFGALTEKLQSLFSSLSGKKVLTEEGISDAVRTVRLALLDADVNYTVASHFVKRVKEKAVGQQLIRSVSAGEQFTKIIHDELIALMGGEETPLKIDETPSVIFLVGLQGAGKTTTSAKLAAHLAREKKKVLLAACDLQRPAAVLQLQKLGADAGLDVFAIEGEKDPSTVAMRALEKAKKERFDVLLIDTAGRLHIDASLMQELKSLKEKLRPAEVLFVASAATGQDAVKTAAEFDQQIGITGTVLTMLDGSARAGAAISIREVTQKPLKFEGIGEKIGDLRPFHPRSMADRILGQGDVINLVRKAEEHFDAESQKELEAKMRKASFTYDDYLKQMGKVKKMGSFSSLLKMLPGVGSLMGDLGNLEGSDQEMKKMEAIISSMTPRERSEQDELSISRRKRIARGSGISFDEVNRMVKGFKRVKQLFKEMPEMKNKFKGSGLSGLQELKKELEGKKWH